MSVLPKLPENVTIVDPQFDVNKCGDAFDVTENGLAVVKKDGKGSVQGTYAMTNKGEGKSSYFYELEYDPKTETDNMFLIGLSQLMKDV